MRQHLDLFLLLENNGIWKPVLKVFNTCDQRVVLIDKTGMSIDRPPVQPCGKIHFSVFVADFIIKIDVDTINQFIATG